MSCDIIKQIYRINCLSAEMDALYHRASLKIGVTDSAMRVLYTIYDNGESCLLSDIYKQSGISKQTVHSAICKLENDGILYLEPYHGKSKKVFLTDRGKVYIKQTAARIYEAESNAFKTWSNEWTQDEINAYLQMLEKYIELFRQQVENL